MNPVIILLGPTGVGKTGASLMLAQELGTEIISADSMQIYRFMDIGTAKPSPEELRAVKHHMINIIDPSGSYNSGKYLETVVPIIEHLHREGKTPLFVGGTGLYIKALTRGLFSGPDADWDLRSNLLSMEVNDRGCLYSLLSEIDPETSEKISRNDTRRIVRALEVCLKSEEKISSLQRRLTSPLPYEFIKLGLTRDRKELYRIIEKRVDDMIEKGLTQEVRKLLELHPDKTPLQAIGYKEIASYLSGETSREEAILLIKRNTKRYAKRQFTWFAKEEGITWVDVTGIHDTGSIYAELRSALIRHQKRVFDE